MGGRYRMRFALELAERGMYVFPLRSGTKLPAVASDWQSRATIDPDVIGQWWERAPFNIGIATGPSGLVVVDLDAPKGPGGRDRGPHGRQSLGALARAAGTTIPRGTFTVITPGGGQHLYFQQPESVELGNTVGRLGRHVDTRAVGGYVVGPGSAVAFGRYRVVNASPPAPLPDWILDRLRPEGPVCAPSGDVERATPAYVRAVVRGETMRVARAPVGQRNQALFRASARLAEFVAVGILTEFEMRSALSAACATHLGVDGFDADEVSRTVDSGLLRRASSRMPSPDGRVGGSRPAQVERDT